MWESVLSISIFPPPGFFISSALPNARSGGGPELLEEFDLGLLHAAGRFGVAEGQGDAQERFDLQSRTQEACGIFQRHQRFQRSPVAVVADAFSPLGIDQDFGLGAGAMVIEIRVEVVAIEAVDALGVSLVDVSVADMLAHDPAVFGLDQAVVAALPGAALGLFDAQFFKQPGDGAVEEFAAVAPHEDTGRNDQEGRESGRGSEATEIRLSGPWLAVGLLS